MLFLPCSMIAMKGVKRMKIKRVVNGQEMEFELTWEEERSAWCAYCRALNIEDIDLYLMSYLVHDPDVCMEQYGVDVRLLQKYMDDIEMKYQELYDYRIDDDMKSDAVYGAVEIIARRIKESGETYESGN